MIYMSTLFAGIFILFRSVAQNKHTQHFVFMFEISMLNSYEMVHAICQYIK